MEAVLAVCLEYPLVLLFLLALDSAVNSLGLKIQSIISTEGKQQLNNKGVTISKKKLKKMMVSLGSGIASAIQAYAVDNNPTLYEQMRFPKSIYLKGDNDNAISACRTIYDIVSLIPQADRDAVGVTDAVLLSFKNLTDDFESKGASSTRKVIVNKTALTKMLATLVAEGNTIMRDKILKLSEQLKDQYPEFYIEVNQAAKLIESNTHTKIRVEGFNDSDGKSLGAGMKVLVTETSKQGVSNAKGLCTMYLKEGIYNLVISMDNFITMNTKVTVIRGSNTIKAQLSPAFTVPAVQQNEQVNS
ncbi:MAG: hypothetical protein ABI855_11190 [Bacteroidota bacterium]